jgi:hypothetical protein
VVCPVHLPLLPYKSLMFILGGLDTWFPEVHDYYWHTMNSLSEFDPRLSLPSPYIPFPAFTINLGSQVVTEWHVDSMNLAHGLCMDVAFGDFNYREGGHVILYEPRLIVELPAGHPFIFGSGGIIHANIPIGEGETRMSVTGYAAGGHFRFVDQGFRTLTSSGEHLRYSLCKEEREKLGHQRWVDGWRRFWTLEQLTEAYNVEIEH